VKFALVVGSGCGEICYVLTPSGVVATVEFVLTREFAVKYTVLIEESDEGFAASVLGLPGCHSQGETEAEALANIRDAIREYLGVVEKLAASAGTKQVAVEV
jgi:predicted RNase H-like HicB family nuclease